MKLDISGSQLTNKQTNFDQLLLETTA